MNYCWAGTASDLLNTPYEFWLQSMSQNFDEVTKQRPSQQQVTAWRGSFEVLQDALKEVVAADENAEGWTLVFEYELPREGGRRPDVVLLAKGNVVVLEFKEKSGLLKADVDQVAAYARDLANYHGASHERPVVPVLLPTQREASEEVRGVHVVAPRSLAGWLQKLETSPPIDADAWLNANYAPLPSVIQAARHIFANEPLPSVRRAQSAGIPKVMDYLSEIVERARAGGERHLVLVTGVPGAGKTLVGLQFVHQIYKDENEANAVLLSGNGPLVQVLQYALKSRAFVQPIRNFFIQHAVKNQSAPPEHLIVFDEAQRAWDRERMGEKYGVDVTNPQLMFEVAERIPEYAVMLALIGEGQEIHIGEEEGIEQWGDAVAGAEAAWTVHLPERLEPDFDALLNLEPRAFLDLTTSLRTHLAEDVQRWVARLLDGDVEGAQGLASSIQQQGFAMYLTRDLETAKMYCRERYEHNQEKRYGLLASSKASNLPKHGVYNDYQSTKRLKVGPWYIDPPDSPNSCCALDAVATEFACQGLELDFPIVCWGSDLRMQEGAWWSKASPRSKARNPHRLRLNAYRVLLSRGRDGFVVFVPPERALDETFAVLEHAGLEHL